MNSLYDLPLHEINPKGQLHKSRAHGAEHCTQLLRCFSWCKLGVGLGRKWIKHCSETGPKLHKLPINKFTESNIQSSFKIAPDRKQSSFFNVSSIQMSGRVTICIPDKSGTVSIRVSSPSVTGNIQLLYFYSPLS